MASKILTYSGYIYFSLDEQGFLRIAKTGSIHLILMLMSPALVSPSTAYNWLGLPQETRKPETTFNVFCAL